MAKIMFDNKNLERKLQSQQEEIEVLKNQIFSISMPEIPCDISQVEE